jgi:hypothetical protein
VCESESILSVSGYRESVFEYVHLREGVHGT